VDQNRVRIGFVKRQAPGDKLLTFPIRSRMPRTILTAPARGANFGTRPVFLTSVSTILGAILFLRFGYGR
jgi:hypothetical protein